MNINKYINTKVKAVSGFAIAFSVAATMVAATMAVVPLLKILTMTEQPTTSTLMTTMTASKTTLTSAQTPRMVLTPMPRVAV